MRLPSCPHISTTYQYILLCTVVNQESFRGFAFRCNFLVAPGSEQVFPSVPLSIHVYTSLLSLLKRFIPLSSLLVEISRLMFQPDQQNRIRIIVELPRSGCSTKQCSRARSRTALNTQIPLPTEKNERVVFYRLKHVTKYEKKNLICDGRKYNPKRLKGPQFSTYTPHANHLSRENTASYHPIANLTG